MLNKVQIIGRVGKDPEVRSRSAQVIIMLKQALERGEQNVSGS